MSLERNLSLGTKLREIGKEAKDIAEVSSIVVLVLGTYAVFAPIDFIRTVFDPKMRERDIQFRAEQAYLRNEDSSNSLVLRLWPKKDRERARAAIAEGLSGGVLRDYSLDSMSDREMAMYAGGTAREILQATETKTSGL